MTSADISRESPSARASVWFVAAVAVFISLLVSGVLTGASAGIVDTDGFMRMSRITDLWSGDVGWWDGFAYRSNAPYGHSMHWTRPLDALVLLLALPIQFFVDSESAIRLGGLAVGPLVFGVGAGTLTWAASPLVGRVGAVVAGLGVSLQPALLEYGSVGRVDHHGLIFLSAALLFGLAVRLALDVEDRRTAARAGVVAAIGIWVSTEMLLPVALFLVVFLVSWIVVGTPRARTMRTFAVWWAAGTVIALLIERAPDMLTSRDLDRISAVHLLVAGLAATFWVLVGSLETDRWQMRALSAAGAGAFTAAILWIVVPGFASGPFGDVPPALWDAWLSRVAELQPLWPFGENPARTVYLLTAPVIGIGLAWKAGVRLGRYRAVWWGIAAVIAGLVGLGVAQARFTAFSQLLGTVAWGWLAATLVGRVADRQGMRASLLRVGSMFAGVAGFLLPVILFSLLPGPEPDKGTIPSCEIDVVIEFLNDHGGEPIVLTHIDWGPEILYRTDAAVVASPYHRNVDGILDARRFLAGEPGEAAQIVADRSVDYLVVCEERDAGYLDGDRADGDMLSLVTERNTPDWLVRRTVESDLRIFEVDHRQLP